jgi:hypothetical protein
MNKLSAVPFNTDGMCLEEIRVSTKNYIDIYSKSIGLPNEFEKRDFTK